jgi:hypothetical protein
MRLSLIILYLPLLACSTTETASSQPVERCSVTDCFNRHQVRDYEVVDDTTLLLFVGAQRCPFLVEFGGAFCDLTFMPGGNVNFRSTGMRRLDMRICASDLHIGIDDGPFSTAAGAPQDQIGRIEDDNDPFRTGARGAIGPGQLPCQIQDVVSLTDDQVLELFVENDVTAPPPPFGTGEIQVKDEEQPGAEQGAERETPEKPQQPTAAPTPNR